MADKTKFSWIRLYIDLYARHRGDEGAEEVPKGSLHFPGLPDRLLHVFRCSCVLVSTIIQNESCIQAKTLAPRYCGQYIASPSLASAGGTLEKIAYGVSIPGFMMTSTLWVHIAAKFVSASQVATTSGSWEYIS